jgi:hypothetical protein
MVCGRLEVFGTGDVAGFFSRSRTSARPSNHGACRVRFSLTMSDEKNYAEQDGKKVTAAITDAPQEEFIADANLPSRTENPNTPEDKAGEEPLPHKQ